MKENFREESSVEEVLEGAELNNLILDERRSSLANAYFLSVLAQSDDTSFKSPILWLEGNNSFDPYRISELSRSLGIRSEKALQGIYISRAFTCYQMKSLILEKLDKGIEEYDSNLIIITGLPQMFSNSDLSEAEALQIFDPVIEKLESFEKLDRTIILTCKKDGGKERNGFISKLETVSNHVIEFEKKKKHSKNKTKLPSSYRKKQANLESTGKVSSLEEFA